jgi:uncharacterized protein (DUF885 family)
LAGGDEGAGRDSQNPALARKPDQLRRLQAADRSPDRRPAFREYEKPVNSDSTFWSDLGYSAQGLSHEQDYKNYIAQLRDFPRYFREQIANMRAGLARGFTPPQVTLRAATLGLGGRRCARPQDEPFYAPFKEMPTVHSRGRAGEPARRGCEGDPDAVDAVLSRSC